MERLGSGNAATTGQPVSERLVREELNDRWVQYTAYDAEGGLVKLVVIPRHPIISDETIAAADAAQLRDQAG